LLAWLATFRYTQYMTLSEITGDTRAILKWAVRILGFIIILFLVFKIKDAIFPAPPPPPTVGFGKLPSPEFPKSASNKNFTYSLDTITGSLPVFPTSQKVFRMLETQPDLLSLSKALKKAKSIGFEGAPVKISENVYQWKDLKKGRTLTMNILNFNFNLSSDFLGNPNSKTFDKDTDFAISVAKDFLQRMNLFQNDLDEVKTKTELFSIKNFSIVPSTSLSNSQIIRVNFFQKPFNSLPIYYPQNSLSPLNFLIGKLSGEIQVVEANFFYQKPSDISSTYPIKTAKEAFSDLKNGKGYVSTAPATSNVLIKKVSVGYYISEKKQNFLLPIVVFEGENFQAFVTAVTDEWVNK